MNLVELTGTLKRTFATIRLYGLAHDNTARAESQLYTAFTAYLDRHGSLCLVVNASTIEVDDMVVIEEERKEESLVRPLFVDGVESLTFLAGVTREELSMVVRAWFGAITFTLDPEHSFATWMWEHDPKSIVASVRPGITEIGTDDNERQRAAEGKLRQLFALLTARVLPKSTHPMAVVDVSSLAVVRAVLGDVSAASLEKRANANDALGLGQVRNERVTLASSLATSSRGAGQRAVFALWREFRATPDEAIGALFARVIAELLEKGRLSELARAVSRIIEDTEESRAFLARIASPETVAFLVKSLESTDPPADALLLLGAIPTSAIDVISEPFAAAPLEVRARLIPLLAQKRPSGESMAMWLLSYGSRIAASLFELSERLEPSARDLLVRSALIHDDPDVILRGMSKITAVSSEDFRSLLAPKLKHPNPDVRRAVLGIYVKSQDPTVPALLQLQLADPAAPLDWQVSCVHGLGTIGGVGAVSVLTTLLESNRSRELRVAAAQALAGIDVPEAHAALTREANRLFGDRTVKKAAKDALKRQERRRASLPPAPEEPA